MRPVDLLLPLLLWLAVALLAAPVDALRWWAGWFPSSERKPAFPRLARMRSRSAPKPAYYVVFFDGISKGTYRNLSFTDDFLEALQAALPEACIVADVLPYSVFNMSLVDARRPFGRFWTMIQGFKERGNPLGFLINIRNFLQTLVSADWRYGLAYNAAMAKLVLFGLVRHGYDLEAPVPIVIIGYSGGGQVAAGVSGLLRRALEVPVHVISLAGVMAGNAAFGSIDSWHQIVSDRDPVEKLGFVLFPMRWPIAVFSPWNRAKRAGKVSIVRLDKARHDKSRSYMDKEAPAPGGGSMLDRTVRTVRDIVRQVMPEARGAAASRLTGGTPMDPRPPASTMPTPPGGLGTP